MDTHAHSDTGRYDEKAWTHDKKARIQHARRCAPTAPGLTHQTHAQSDTHRTPRARKTQTQYDNTHTQRLTRDRKQHTRERQITGILALTSGCQQHEPTNQAILSTALLTTPSYLVPLASAELGVRMRETSSGSSGSYLSLNSRARPIFLATRRTALCVRAQQSTCTPHTHRCEIGIDERRRLAAGVPSPALLTHPTPAHHHQHAS